MSARQVLNGSDTQIPAVARTVRTSGEALNFNRHLHGLLADGAFEEAGIYATGGPRSRAERKFMKIKQFSISQLVAESATN